MRQDRFYIQETEGNHYVTADGRLVPTLEEAGNFNKREAQRIAEGKFGHCWEAIAVIKEFPWPILRNKFFTEGRKKPSAKRTKHLKWVAGMPRTYRASHALISLLAKIEEHGAHKEIMILAGMVKSDYRNGIKAWRNYHIKQLKKIKQTKTPQL